MMIYTDHAEQRMTKRFISKLWVEEAIRNPGTLIQGKYGKMQAINEVNGEEYSVIYAKERGHYIVITVFWGR